MVNGFHNNEQALMMVPTVELNFPQQLVMPRLCCELVVCGYCVADASSGDTQNNLKDRGVE